MVDAFKAGWFVLLSTAQFSIPVILHYDEAIEQYRKTIDLDRYFEIAHVWLAWAYQQKRMWEESIRECEYAARLSGPRIGILATLAITYAVSGNSDKAIKTLNKINKVSNKTYISPYYIACIYAALKTVGQRI